MSMIKGFSKLDKKERMARVAEVLGDPEEFIQALKAFDHPDPAIQQKLDSFSENTLANFPVPLGVAPNFLINGRDYFVPMVIEESSVVAAASWAARFWYTRGGFKVEVKNLLKEGQLHFTWTGDESQLRLRRNEIEAVIRKETADITANMIRRGGGIESIELVENVSGLTNYFQLRFRFLTVDSMGANFINSVLETAGVSLGNYLCTSFPGTEYHTIMAILSNYTPDCRVRAELRCKIDELKGIDRELNPEEFAKKFVYAVKISSFDTFRAVTHNKGIFNGIDAVIMATGNDYRAVEAAGHAWAARNGNYSGLSQAGIDDDEFWFRLELPMAVGTVGGLTSLHPLVKWSLAVLGNPDAKELMMIAAAAGLANNFAAVKALTTQGIQKGHMKMHLDNILNFHHASEEEKVKAREYFRDKTVSYKDVEQFLGSVRNN